MSLKIWKNSAKTKMNTGILCTQVASTYHMEPVKGTPQLQDVTSCRGEKDGSNSNLRKLQISIKPCSCLKCCGKANGVCEFKEYWQEKVIWVQEECNYPGNQTKQARQPTIKLTQLDKEKLKEKMGVEKVTNESLRTYLKAKGQKVSGQNKAELVLQVLALQQDRDDPVPLVLTTVVVEDKTG